MSEPSQKTRVMVVNDSFHAKELLANMVKSSSSLELAGTASDGMDAMEKIDRLRPNVILLDLEMPKMDGLTFIDKVMAVNPLPIIVCSSYSGGESEKGADVVFESLDAGAIDFIPINSSILKVGSYDNKQILDRIEQAAKAAPKTNGVNVANKQHERLIARNPQRSTASLKSSNGIIVIGSSTGGPQVLTKIFSELPSDLPVPLLVVQHMPQEFTRRFAAHLGQASSIEVSEAREGDKLVPGKAIVAQGGYHMIVNKSKKVTMVDSDKRKPCQARTAMKDSPRR